MPSYTKLCERAKLNNFTVGITYPDSNDTIQIYVKSKYVEFVRLSIKPAEIDVASKIIIETFEKERIWMS